MSGKKVFCLCILLFLFAVFCVLYRNSRFYYHSPVFSVGALKFQEKTVVIKSGELYQLRLFCLNKRIRYKSGNTMIACVTGSGKILGLKPGKTVITARVGEETVKIRVIVE